MSQPVDCPAANCSSPLLHATSTLADLSDTLQHRIDEAQAELRRTGFVRIWYRQALYAALGPRHPDHKAAVFGTNRTLGHRRRTLLALYTLERILPIWEQSYQPRGLLTRELVPDIVTIIRRLDAGDHTAINDFGKPCHPFLSYCETQTRADHVLVAAGQAYHVALYDADYQLDPLPPYCPDYQLQEIRRWPPDVPRLAADAEAQGPNDLQAFWEWWLTCAIPAAWHVVT